jgi:hypothetical protein
LCGGRQWRAPDRGRAKGYRVNGGMRYGFCRFPSRRVLCAGWESHGPDRGDGARQNHPPPLRTFGLIGPRKHRFPFPIMAG